MPKIETVNVETEAGAVRINRDEFNPATHTLADKQDDDFVPFDEPEAVARVAPPAPVAPVAPVTPPAPPAPPITPAPPIVADKGTVAKVGRKWQIVAKDGSKVDGTDDDYHNEDAAKEALAAL